MCYYHWHRKTATNDSKALERLQVLRSKPFARISQLTPWTVVMGENAIP